MPETSVKKISLPKSITVKKFSEVLGLSLNIVITELMKNGILATINERIDFETASIIAQDLGYEVSEETVENAEGMTWKNSTTFSKRKKNQANI
jgi:translation initiation factor IF-2